MRFPNSYQVLSRSQHECFVRAQLFSFHSYLSVTVGCQNIRNIFWKATSDQNPHTIMEFEEQDSSFLCYESDLSHLESVVQAYFNPRPVEDDLEDDDSSDFSSDEDDDHEDNIDSDNDFEFEFSEVDKSERVKVEAFLSQGCGCTHGDQGKPCSTTIKTEEIIDCRNNCFELSSSELDLVILGTIHSSLNCDEASNSGRAEKKRQRTRMSFYYHSHRIC